MWAASPGGMRGLVVTLIGCAIAATPAAADPSARPEIDVAQTSLAIGASAFADGTLQGVPLGLGVGRRVPGQPLWWQATVAYGATRRLDGAAGRVGEVRVGPRVVRCGLRGYLCGGAGAE